MFSVLIPVYNHEAYLPFAIESALRSTLVDEILLVDDGSKDGSLKIIEQYASVYQGKVRNLTTNPVENKGAHARLNELVEAATSKWVAVLNSDDAFVPGRLELCAAMIRMNKPDLISGHLLIMNDQGQIIGTKRGLMQPEYPLPQSPLVRSAIEKGDVGPFLLNQNYIATTSNTVFTKELHRRVGGFADFRYVHDWDFVLRASLTGNFLFIPQFLSIYRVHRSNTISESHDRTTGEVRAMFDRLIHDFPNIEDDPLNEVVIRGNRYLDKRAREVTASSRRRVGRHSMKLAVIGPAGQCLSVSDEQALAENVAVESRGYREALFHAYEYVYSPCAGLPTLGRVAIENCLLCLAHTDLDFVIVSHTLSNTPKVVGPHLRNQVVFNRAAAEVFAQRKAPTRQLYGRVLRLLPAPDGPEMEFDLNQVLAFAAPQVRGADILLAPRAAKSAQPRTPVERRHIAFPGKGNKPIVFVLPIFMAVGGVERNAIEIMRHLGDRYEFVVITTEPLAEHQGSLHHQLPGVARAVFDLGELADSQRHLEMLRTLKGVYRPDLVWICNGSPWLSDNALHVREIFSDVPIVDQQVYDTEVGWIGRYHEAGVQSFDRFIAINSRIREVFVNRLGMDEQRIDLIYHAIDAKKFESSLKLSEAERQRAAEHLGLTLGSSVIGFVGRLTQQKRPLDFLEIAKRAQTARFGEWFVLVGSGELEKDCIEFIERNNLTNVRRISYVKDVSRLFPLLAGLVITSEYEGLPIAMLEALACGVPVLATDVGDIGLVLERFQSGSVVKEIGDVDMMWNEFERWRTDLENYKNHALANANAVRQEFSADAVALKYDRSWKTAIDCVRGNANQQS